MGWSFKIARVADTEIRVHGTFLLLLGWYAWMAYETGGIKNMVEGSVLILLLFTCVLLHELGHATAARRYGIRTPDITLLPIGGIARLERLPDKPSQEIVVALAGPAVNVVIAILLFAGMGGTLSSLALSLETNYGYILPQLFAANVILVAFNLIPAFPMDGGRVLRAALALFLDRTRATIIAARIGQGIALLFIAAGVATWFGWTDRVFGSNNILLPFIGLFILLAAQQEMAFAVFKQAAEKICVGQVMASRFLALPFDLSLAAAMEEISKEPMSDYPLVDNQLHLRGMVHQREIREMSCSFPERTLLEIGFQLPAIRAEDTCSKAFEIMQQHQTVVLPVINLNGQVVGIVGTAQLANEAPGLISERKKRNNACHSFSKD